MFSKMALLIHVSLALFSLGYVTYLFVRPSAARIGIGLALTGLTLASGVYLAIVQPGQLGRVCLSGIVYLAIMLYVINLSSRRLKKLQRQSALVSEQEAYHARER